MHFTHAAPLSVGDTAYYRSNPRFGGVNVGTVIKISPSGQITVEVEGQSSKYTVRFSKSGEEIGGSRCLIAKEVYDAHKYRADRRQRIIAAKNAAEAAAEHVVRLTRGTFFNDDDAADVVAKLEEALRLAKAI